MKKKKESFAGIKARRLCAMLFDAAIAYFLMFACVIGPLVVALGESSSSNPVSAWTISFFCLMALLGIALDVVYLTVTAFLFHGATAGMKVFGISFRQGGGAKIPLGKILNRETNAVLLFYLTLGLCGISDLLSVILSEKGTTFHDEVSLLDVRKVEE